MRSGTYLSQFLRVFLPTLNDIEMKIEITALQESISLSARFLKS